MKEGRRVSRVDAATADTGFALVVIVHTSKRFHTISGSCSGVVKTFLMDLWVMALASYKFGFGVPGRIRTRDPLLRRQPLYPLSYWDGAEMRRVILLAAKSILVTACVSVN